MRRAIAPVLEGARLESVEIRDPRLVRPFDPAIVADALVGERVGEVGRRGKYLIVGFESGRSLLIHLRMTGSLRHAPSGTLADDPYTRAVLRLDNGSDVGYRDVRRFGTWELFEPERARALSRRAPRARAARPVFGRPARPAARRAPGAAQVRAARPENGRRSREHLRRRGALAEPAPSAAGRRQPRRRRARPPLPGGAQCPPQGDRAPGVDAPRLRHARRRLRHDAGRVPRLRTWGRAVRPLRAAAHPDRRRRAHDHVLPALPAASPEA